MSGEALADLPCIDSDNTGNLMRYTIASSAGKDSLRSSIRTLRLGRSCDERRWPLLLYTWKGIHAPLVDPVPTDQTPPALFACIPHQTDRVRVAAVAAIRASQAARQGPPRTPKPAVDAEKLWL